MKKLTFLLLLSGLTVLNADAAVKLERLADFDTGVHRIAVNIEVNLAGGCAVDAAFLKEKIEGMLRALGFQTGSFEDSQLEFAVAVKGLKGPESKTCGLMFTSMARQIPLKKILRISPGSHSARYRLWQVENVILAKPTEIQGLLQSQAREDLAGFSRTLERASGR